MTKSIPSVAFILAAGKGTRLAPLTNERPKPMVEVMGVPLVEIALMHAQKAGVKCVVINTHHLHWQIQNAFGDSYGGLPIYYSHEEVLLGTGGGFKKMYAVLQEKKPELKNGPFLAINADAFADVDVKMLIQTHKNASEKYNATGTLLLKKVSNAKRYGVIGSDAAGRILHFAGRADVKGEITEERMFCGIHIFTRALLERLPEAPYGEGGMCINREGYPKAMLDDEWLQAASTDAYFQDVGTKERLLQTQLDLMSGEKLGHLDLAVGLEERELGVFIHVNAKIGTNVKFIAPVVVHEAEIADDVELGPYVVVGNRCNIENGAQVRLSCLQSGARVASETVNSFLVMGREVSMHVSSDDLSLPD